MFDSCDEGLFWAPAQQPELHLRSDSAAAQFHFIITSSAPEWSAPPPGIKGLNSLGHSAVAFCSLSPPPRFESWQHHRELLRIRIRCSLTLTVFLVIICKKSRALEHISNVTLPQQSKKKLSHQRNGFQSQLCAWYGHGVRRLCKLFYCGVCTCRRRLLSKFNEFILNSSLAESELCFDLPCSHYCKQFGQRFLSCGFSPASFSCLDQFWRVFADYSVRCPISGVNSQAQSRKRMRQ